MKGILKIIVFIIVINAVTFVSCSKDDERASNNYTSNPPPSPPSPPSPPNLGKIIKARIVEYNSGKPLVGAMVEVVRVPGGLVNLTTNENGECWFNANQVAFRAFTKVGYWNYSTLNSPFYPDVLAAHVEFYPINYSSIGNFDFYTGRAYSCDSFVIRLFPKTYITLHIKDSSHLPQSDLYNHIIFAVNGLFSLNGFNYSVYSGAASNQDGEIIRLRPGIDTTFQLPVFGNIQNQFSIGEDDASNGWAGFNYYLRRDTIFILNGSNIKLNISY